MKRNRIGRKFCGVRISDDSFLFMSQLKPGELLDLPRFRAEIGGRAKDQLHALGAAGYVSKGEDWTRGQQAEWRRTDLPVPRPEQLESTSGWSASVLWDVWGPKLPARDVEAGSHVVHERPAAWREPPRRVLALVIEGEA